MAAITQTIKDNGIVMVYMQSGNQWIALPWSDTDPSWSDNYGFEVNTGTITINYSGFDNTGSPGVAAVNGKVVRIVAVSSASAYPNIIWNNYLEVKKNFNLAD